jgi:hypothetical protein
MRTLICAVLAMAALLAAPAANAERDDGPAPAPVGLKIVDFVLVRPFCFVGSVVSTSVYAALLPITFPTGVAGDLGTYMVTVPWRFTASRYYGNFGVYRDHRTVQGAMIADAR